MRDIVYVCSPYAGDIEGNTAKARECCKYVLKKGKIPFAPHLLYPQFMDETSERQEALDMGIEMMRKCKEIWIFGRYISDGMKYEIEYAQTLDKPFKFVEVENEST